MKAEENQGSAAQSANSGRQAQMFRKLTAVQISRLEAHASKLTTREGEVLAEPGERRPMYVVLSGSVEVVQVGIAGEVLVVLHTPGSFSGEMSTLRGIGGVVRMRVREASSRCIAFFTHDQIAGPPVLRQRSGSLHLNWVVQLFSRT
jgi:CRP-like cAMP-binding protein